MQMHTYKADVDGNEKSDDQNTEDLLKKQKNIYHTAQYIIKLYNFMHLICC